MAVNRTHRTSVIRSLLPTPVHRLMDVGSGPVIPSYPYADKAAQITCVDWKLQSFGSIPSNIECIDGDFTKMDLPKGIYDAIIAADVFEHIALEEERKFAEKCIFALKPGGHLIVSVPHQGTFAFLDPYRVKPAIYRQLWRVGLYKNIHNGNCDIRKGHKHFTTQELTERFRPLRLTQVAYHGYLFDPLLSWAMALSRDTGKFPGYTWLENACKKEYLRDYAQRSFNIVAKFTKDYF